MLEKELKQIIAEYRAEVDEAGSEHARQAAKDRAFRLILETVEAGDAAEKGAE